MNNDLISRPELKKAIIKRLGIKSEEFLLASERTIYDEIDNAPTVNTVNLEKQSFIDGFKEGCEHGKKCYERPQGEWIKWNFKTFGAMGDWEYKCSNCGKVYDGEYNFCPNCGADMRKGGAE